MANKGIGNMKHVKNAQDRVNSNPAVWILVLGTVFTALLGIMGFIGAFTFNEVAAAPKVYETKDDHNRDIDRIYEGQNRMEGKIDKLIESVGQLR
jgi:hypothetical protein